MKLVKTARMCPACGEDSKVRRTIELQDGTIRRVRHCPACGARFLTLERLLSEVLAAE